MRNPQQDVPDHALIVATFARSTVARSTVAAPAPPGAVMRLSGTVAPAGGAPLVAPLSGRPCVWFRSITEHGPSLVESSLTGEGRVVATPHRFVRSDMRVAHDPRAEDHESDAPVLVRDAAGNEVTVELRGADVDATEISVDVVEEAADGSRIARREWIVEPGAAVFVLGEVVAPGPVLRATPTTAAVLSTHDEAAVYQRSQGYLAAGGPAGTATAPPGSTSASGRTGLLGPSRALLVTVGAVAILVVVVVLVVLLAS